MTTPMKLPSWTAHLPQWIPHSLDELSGPFEGIIDLPLIVCWSGKCSGFDLARFAHRVWMYEIVIVQGGAEHYREFLNKDHLLDAWPILHRALGHGYMQAWEDRFPELARLGADARLWEEMRIRWKAATQ